MTLSVNFSDRVLCNAVKEDFCYFGFTLVSCDYQRKQIMVLAMVMVVMRIPLRTAGIQMLPVRL